ncbi:MAG TPA: hypothetical protein VLC95_08105 [Anaerolineae bacterium]|nr:hypothetical protein [Anaerolineae bacterium]
MDEDFWKERYQDRWGAASQREVMVARLLEEEVGCTVAAGPGLGAGSAEYLPGAAHRHGAERGGADLHVVGTNVYVEVTGPLAASVGPEADLWIRPDKIESALAHPERDHWIVHALHDNQTLRVIHLDAGFERAHQNGRFELVTPTIQGVQERYVAVPARSGYVEPIGILVDHLRRGLRESGAPAEGHAEPASPPPSGPLRRPAPPPLPQPPPVRREEGEPGELSACPVCGSTRVAQIVYGNIRVTEEVKRAMDAGLVEFGGLGEYEGMPTRRCLACKQMFGRWVRGVNDGHD